EPDAAGAEGGRPGRWPCHGSLYLGERHRVQFLPQGYRGGRQPPPRRYGRCDGLAAAAAGMSTPRAIRHIVFDIGWVLVRLHSRPLLGLLAAGGAEPFDRNTVMTRIGLEEHETGQLHGHGLLQRLQALAGLPVSLEEVRAKWLDMFEPEPAMIDLAHRLSER